MGLARPLMRALDGRSFLRTLTRRCIVMPAARAAEEGADLRDERPAADSPVGGDERSNDPPVMILQLLPATLVDAAAVERLLDHELLHVEDMLDPSFGYRRELPAPGGGPARLRRATDRYRVLWDCSIDGRLQRLGRAPGGARDRRRREFAAAFPELEPETDDAFGRWYDGPRPTHDEMLSAACAGGAGSPAGICPMCGFACADLRHDHALPEPARALVRADFPEWRPDEGACRQCLDLYVARSVEPA
jgi:hypothetical protein